MRRERRPRSGIRARCGGLGGSPSTSSQLTSVGTNAFTASVATTGTTTVTTTGFGGSSATTGFGGSDVGVSTISGFGERHRIGTTDATTAVAVATVTDATSTVTTGFFDGGDPCSSGADCTQCPNQSACYTCTATAHPAGVADYNALASCILCSACYVTCQGDAQMGFCGPPGPVGPCDVGAPQTGCNACEQCAVNSVCQATLDACMQNQDCLAILQQQCN